MTTEVVAAFDVDGTLTRRDSVTGFLRRAGGTGRLVLGATRHLPLLAGVAGGWVERDVAKARMLQATLAGRDASEVDRIGRAYAEQLRTRLRPDTLARLRWHQGEGHRTVLVSASLRPYLGPLGEWLGVDHVLCTELATDGSGRLTGAIEGANCRGPEKVARLVACLGGEPVERYAYGDSAGDRELLAWATRPLLVKRVTVSAVP